MFSLGSKYRVASPESVAPLHEPSATTRTRPSLTHRPINIKPSIIKNANGSCYLEQGSLKLLCTVHGPKQAPKTLLSTAFTFAPFAKPGRAQNPYQKSDEEKEFGVVLHQALMAVVMLGEKTRVDVSVVVLECDGTAACLAAAVTCASLALMDAGVEMTDLVVGCSIGFKGEQVFVDCTGDEERDQDGSMFLAYLPNRNQVAHIVQAGEMSMKITAASMEVCIDSCVQVASIVREIILNK